MDEWQRELARREEERTERDKKLENKPFTRALLQKKEGWYDRVPLSVRQLDVLIAVSGTLLALVFLLILLEATGLFKIG